MVDAAEVLEAAVGEPPREIAGAIEPRVRALRGPLDETLRGELGPAQVAARDAGAADVHLAGDAARHELAFGIEQQHAQVGNRPADHAAGACFDVGAQNAAGRSRVRSSR